MKLFLGSVAAAGVLIAATAAAAQVLPSYRIGGGAIVSDVDGPYAAMPPRPRYAQPVLEPREIDAIARDSGFSPLGAPQQRGFVYTISAINLDGEDGRLVIDARDGRILRFMPAYRMGDRMNEEIVTTYGPVGPPPALPEPRPDYRAAPRPPAPLPRMASRTPNVPLPKAAPPHAVATPPKPVAAAPVAAPPLATSPPLVPESAQQSAAVQPKAAETTGAVAAGPTVAQAPVEARASADAAPATEAKPAAEAASAPSGIQPTQAMPPVQGLE
jgi:hypothetical protein